MTTETLPEQDLLLADEFDRGYMIGYRSGEMERIALATANSDLRSDLMVSTRLATAATAELSELKKLIDR